MYIVQKAGFDVNETDTILKTLGHQKRCLQVYINEAQMNKVTS